jgi:hypothetical protein
MKRTVLLAVCLSLGMGACSSDGDNKGNPTGSGDVAGSELVGAWSFESSNIVEVFGEFFRQFLAAFGASEEEIAAALEELENSPPSSGPFQEQLILNADNTWSGGEGSGTWSAEGDHLTITGTSAEGEEEITPFTYSISGDRLTLTLDVEDLLAVVSEAEQQAMQQMGIDLSNSLVIVLVRAN